MRKLLLILLAPLLLVTLLPQRAHADTQNFVINSFDADYTLTRQDKQGSLHTVEDISLTFNSYNHGILRAIPQSYKGHSMKLHVNKVSSSSDAPTQFSTSTDNGNTVLKIGDAGKTITGPQQYTIDYTLENVISFYEDHDELYWDINGDQWKQPFEHVSLKLHLPDGLRVNGQLGCFGGLFGGTNQPCTITQETGTTITAQTTAPLHSSETLTVVAGFQKGYFAPYTASDYAAEYAKILAPMVILPLIVFVYSFRRWHKLGRDPKGRGTIVPEYEPPDGLKPIEIGSIVDFKTDNKDLTATIVDLAVHGYVKIIENKKDRLIGKDKLSYQLELTGKDEKDLTFFEAAVLAGLRGAAPSKEAAAALSNHASLVVSLDDLKQKFYTTAQSVRASVQKGLTAQGYFTANPVSAGGRLFVLGGFLFLLVFMLGGLGVGLIAGLVISALIAFAFGIVMPSRTAKGVEALDKLKGLKLYLETAEKDRIAMLQAPDAKYAANHETPAKTVELFEKLLPYAMVLGVENKWAQQFKDIYTSPPDWYSGNWTSFNTVLLIGSLNGSMNAVNTVAFSSPSSSGSSGFGGGGFSGGGGGGGGGGGW